MAKRSTALCYKAMTYNGRDVHQCFSENTQIHTSAAKFTCCRTYPTYLFYLKIEQLGPNSTILNFVYFLIL